VRHIAQRPGEAEPHRRRTGRPPPRRWRRARALP
jgi:hypothetical protein